MPSPSPSLRILTDPEAVESLARHRLGWAALWGALILESSGEPEHVDPDDREDEDEAA